MSTVVVTGGAGYVGSHAVKALAAAGDDVVVYDDLSAGHAEAVDRIAAAFPNRAVSLVKGDMLDRAAFGRVLASTGATAVMHFAARLLVGESVREPIGYYRANVTGTMAVLEAMADAGVKRFVFSSTAATFGEPRESPITEEHPQQPDQRLRRDEARDRAGAPARRARDGHALGGPAVLQRGRRRP